MTTKQAESIKRTLKTLKEIGFEDANNGILVLVIGDYELRVWTRGESWNVKAVKASESESVKSSLSGTTSFNQSVYSAIMEQLISTVRHETTVACRSAAIAEANNMIKWLGKICG